MLERVIRRESRERRGGALEGEKEKEEEEEEEKKDGEVYEEADKGRKKGR